MKLRMKKILALMLAISVCASMTSCGRSSEKGNTATDSGIASEDTKIEDSVATSIYDTLVVGVQELDGVFHPLFCNNVSDAQVINSIFANVSSLNSNGKLVDEAGHIEVEEVTAEDGHTQYLYTVTIQDGMTFSDGEAVTIDDVLFYYYVAADPTYDGMSTFGTLDIVGMQEYYYDTLDYNGVLEELEKYQLENISEEDFITYIEATKAEGWYDDIAMSEGGPIGDGLMTWAQYCSMCGVASSEEATAIADDAEMLTLVAKAEWAVCADAYDPYSYYKTQFVANSLSDGIDVAEISGIKKIDEYTCTVLLDSANVSAEQNIAGIPLIPEHYYGEDFTKGNLSGVKEKNTVPMGSGEYVFQKYEDDKVVLTSNANYFNGSPNVPNLEFQVVKEEDKISRVLNGEIDIMNVGTSPEIATQLDENSSLVSYTLVDEPEYGYIGINAERVPDINVRKGLMCLMNREVAINEYYGKLGKVVERPMIPTLAEYPDDAEPYYTYDPAKALEYFHAAGYTQVDGKLVNAAGKQLCIEVGVDDASTHPETAILTQMASDMATMGAEITINDLQFSELSAQVQYGELDMWVMESSNMADCDLTPIFGSEGDFNYQKFYSKEIDELQAEILTTVDFEKRCELVVQELDLIMDAAVYMPLYQKKSVEVYNKTKIDTTTLPEETTIYNNYSSQYEKLKLK